MQLPLPKHLDEEAIVKAINPRKDVDGFHPHHRQVSSLCMTEQVSLFATSPLLERILGLHALQHASVDQVDCSIGQFVHASSMHASGSMYNIKP